MKQQSIDLGNEFQPATEETFFEEQTVQRIPAVIPLNETPTKTSARRFQKLRVPMRKADKSFNPAFLLMALLAVTALGVIAGTMVYRTSTEKSAVNNAATDTDDPVNRTIPAQYQFVVDKPGDDSSSSSSSSSSSLPTGTEPPRDNLSRDDFNSLPPSTSEPVKRDSRNRQDGEESSAPDAENEQQQNAENEETGEETQGVAPRKEDEEELPPPPPLRRDRREDKKQDKPKQKTNTSQPENRQQNEQPAADAGSETESEN
ncbi:MAG: hypothetical protein M3384_09805 [Acidobacteriota bacterium]|nr:hypothetical protein [Acidobacteriota bacterium]